MASSKFRHKLDPYRRLREPLGVNVVRQSVVIPLGKGDVVVPGTARLAFTITLDSTDANKTVAANLGRVIVRKTTVKISGNEVLSIDDSDILLSYFDHWKTATERKNDQYQGIDTSNNRNTTRI